ncbi:hypothetical protein CE91St41_28840 [Oscillospiraceae bacterium]|nr:hypothetical protein CE91St40_28840 [Oscillospiraceae bacterium]BDF75995.1 hypothetical protein CE91St41_28840 [Oscillospiraceae bacterium]
MEQEDRRGKQGQQPRAAPHGLQDKIGQAHRAQVAADQREAGERRHRQEEQHRQAAGVQQPGGLDKRPAPEPQHAHPLPPPARLAAQGERRDLQADEQPRQQQRRRQRQKGPGAAQQKPRVLLPQPALPGQRRQAVQQLPQKGEHEGVPGPPVDHLKAQQRAPVAQHHAQHRLKSIARIRLAHPPRR